MVRWFRRGGDANDAPSGQHIRRGVSLSSRLAATVLGVGLVSLLAATAVGLNAGQSLGRTIVNDSLTALRASGAIEVVAQLRYYQGLAGSLASSAQAPIAVEEFSAALSELPPDDSEQDLRARATDLLDAYSEQYLEPLRAGGRVVQLNDILSTDRAALYLQSTYSLPQEPIQQAIAVDDAGDGSAWSDVHALVHPVYRNAVEQADLMDVYLVDADTERVVYSAAKGPELGTSLAVGPFSGSIVARAADAAAMSDQPVATDLGFFDAEPGVPIGAAAAAITDGDDLVGVVVLTYDASVYTERLAALVAAGEADNVARQDLYLIGTDGRTRSDPVRYLNDPPDFLDASVAASVLSPTGRAAIERNSTTVLVQPGFDETVNRALDGKTDPARSTSMTGVAVVEAARQLPTDQVTWYAVAEVDSVDAEAPVSLFQRILLVGAAVFVAVLAFAAVAWARRVMRPVRTISERLARSVRATEQEADVSPVAIPDRSPIEFHRLAGSFSAMGASLRRQQRELRAAREERLTVLQRMLPASVAQRIARGDADSLDEVPSASVVVVVALGLGALVREEAASGDRRLVDQLHAELDGIASDNGLERIKIVGDSYIAVCGHDRPYIDHAPRAVAFAEQVGQAVRGLAVEAGVSLDAAAGVSTGPLVVDVSGNAQLIYDVWGPTVTTAHHLARAARAGQIVVTDATRARLPDDIALEPWQPNTSPALSPSLVSSEHGVWTVVQREPAQDGPQSQGSRR
jgi:class 3 adenylate cyclase